jgi:hypothetical protein
MYAVDGRNVYLRLLVISYDSGGVVVLKDGSQSEVMPAGSMRHGQDCAPYQNKSFLSEGRKRSGVVVPRNISLEDGTVLSVITPEALGYQGEPFPDDTALEVRRTVKHALRCRGVECTSFVERSIIKSHGIRHL